MKGRTSTVDSNEKKDSLDEIIKFMNYKFKRLLKNLDREKRSTLQEIRIRVDVPTVIVCLGKSFVLDRESVATFEDVKEIFNLLCEYSVYSFENQIKDGFITICGGHRVGLCGNYVFSKGGKISSIKELTSLNIRIAREFPNCSEDIFKEIKNDFLGALIVGPPCCGKTTLIRDLAHKISLSEELNFPKTCIIDERMEIASCRGGKVQFNVGFSDVFTGVPKSIGILQAVRCLSPNIIICDEVGTTEESLAMKAALNCGVRVISTLHAFGANDFLKRPQSVELINSGAFEKIIFLDNRNFGKIKKIYTKEDLYAENYGTHTFDNLRRVERFHLLR